MVKQLSSKAKNLQSVTTGIEIQVVRMQSPSSDLSPFCCGYRKSWLNSILIPTSHPVG